MTGEYKLTYRLDRAGFIGACDASWADVYESSKSTSGVVFMYYGAALVWYSQTQKSVSHSSTESEYYAIHNRRAHV